MLKRQSVAQLLFRAARLLNERALERLREATGREVSVAHTRLLPFIDFEGVRPTALAERAGISKQAVGQLVRDMEALGMVRRERDPEDGRAVLVRFTDQGLDGIKEGLRVLGDVEGELALALGEDRMERLHDDLLALMEHLDAEAP